MLQQAVMWQVGRTDQLSGMDCWSARGLEAGPAVLASKDVRESSSVVSATAALGWLAAQDQAVQAMLVFVQTLDSRG